MNDYVAGQKVKTYIGSDAVVIKQDGLMVITDIGEFHWTKILDVEESSENSEESAQDEAVIDNSLTISAGK